MEFKDSFLRNLPESELRILRDMSNTWNINQFEFSKRLDSWFKNFYFEDKGLALKVLKNINYYSESQFKSQVSELFISIKRYLHSSESKFANLIVIVPDDFSDSAIKHAYDISKLWGIPKNNICNISALRERANSKSILVAFNDTHGTGRQYILGIWHEIKNIWPFDDRPPVLLAAVTIAEKALRYFEHEFSNQRVVILNKEFESSAQEIFSVKEYNKLEEYGYKIYPPHPMGYGESGLLTAYHFQCPNNSLPIIWADGKNNEVNNNAYPWSPLFAYKPKIKSLKIGQNLNEKKQDYFSFAKWSLTDPERNELNETISRWICNDRFSIRQQRQVENWFENFPLDLKWLAMKIFNNTEFFGITRIRKMIAELKAKVIGNNMMLGLDNSDVLLVLTGYEKPSVYHYVYDFLKIWNLKVSQAIILEELKEYQVLNKSLVYFYHTRSESGEYFLNEIWNRVKDYPARIHYVTSFAISKKTKEDFANMGTKVKIYSCEETLKDIGSIFSKEEIQIIKSLVINRKLSITDPLEDDLLIAYYFLCPNITASILRESSNNWQPLFDNGRVISSGTFS